MFFPKYRALFKMLFHQAALVVGIVHSKVRGIPDAFCRHGAKIRAQVE